MKAVNFKESTGALTNKQGSTIYTLPVYSNGRQYVSLWELSLKERISVILFGRIWLTVQGMVNHSLTLNATYTVFKRSKTATSKKSLKKLAWILISLAAFVVTLLIITYFIK